MRSTQETLAQLEAEMQRMQLARVRNVYEFPFRHLAVLSVLGTCCTAPCLHTACSLRSA